MVLAGNLQDRRQQPVVVVNQVPNAVGNLRGRGHGEGRSARTYVLVYEDNGNVGAVDQVDKGLGDAVV